MSEQLTREQIEKIRSDLIQSNYSLLSTRAELRALCDLALRALQTDEYRRLLTAAINMSDELHNAEQNGVELPAYVDNAWLHLSYEIEASRSRFKA